MDQQPYVDTAVPRKINSCGNSTPFAALFIAFLEKNYVL
jgi:hypothetical protein